MDDRVFQVGGAIAFLLGLAASVQQLGSWYMARQARVPSRISWRRIEKGILELIRQCRSDGFVPDLVVGIGRSGAITGGMLAGNMRNIPLALLDRQMVWDQHRREYVQSEFTRVSISPDCRRILVVIGEVYSGQSMVECLRHLSEALGDREVRTACLVQSASSAFRCDYSALVVDRAVTPAWVLSKDYARYGEGTMEPARL